MIHKGNHYVYELVDPRDGKPFYIGKGSGKRLYGHLLELKRGYSSNKRKLAQAREIQALGMDVIARTIERFSSDADAMAYERRLIAEIDGLTNVLAGGRRGWGEWSRAEIQRRANGR